MPELVLTTLNAKYQHASFGLRYLMANLGPLAEHAVMLEFGITQSANDMLDAILEQDPRIVGVGVYIWNVEASTRLVADLKQVRPDMVVILGGPEVSYETDTQEIVRLADYVLTGEADLSLPRLCAEILANRPPTSKVIAAELPALQDLQLPYQLYTAEDVANRVIYVEASRGCPFTCEFCLSALEIPVRQGNLELFLNEMQSLLERGATRFKFVDRTFNLNVRIGCAILEFFLERMRPGLFLHFEMIPDRLPEALREPIRRFPPGALQFEIGIQTFNEEVSERISRRQDNAVVEQNLRFLRAETGVHVHADLIVGLPGETVDSFAIGFDRLVQLDPQEIQVGILKRLRGTPIVRHDAEWEMVYSPHPPYEILQNRNMTFAQLQLLRRFARYWDLVANSGNFVETTPLLWSDLTPFAGFSKFSEWLFAEVGRTHGVSLIRLAEIVFQFLTTIRRLPEEQVAECLWRDYRRGGRRDRPHFLRRFTLETGPLKHVQDQMPTRQARHAAVPE